MIIGLQLELPISSFQTSLTESIAHGLGHSLIVAVHGVLLPHFAVFAAEDNHFTFSAAQRSVVRHLKHDGAVELDVRRTHLEDAAGEAFTIVERRRSGHLVLAQQAADDTDRAAGSARRDGQAKALMAAAAEAAATRIHQEGHEEAAKNEEGYVKEGREGEEGARRYVSDDDDG